MTEITLDAYFDGGPASPAWIEVLETQAVIDHARQTCAEIIRNDLLKWADRIDQRAIGHLPFGYGVDDHTEPVVHAIW